MTDMVFGAAPARPGEAILPEWWRTVDRWSLAAVLALFMIGMLLNLAASPPLAVRNGLAPFHYVTRQAVFGAMALTPTQRVADGHPVAALERFTHELRVRVSLGAEPVVTESCLQDHEILRPFDPPGSAR